MTKNEAGAVDKSEITAGSGTSKWSEGMRDQRGFLVGMTLYVVAVVVSAAILRSVDDRPDWLGAALAVPVVGALAYALFSQRAAMRRREGVEKLVYTETTALAFWIVMVSAVAWFFLEAWSDVDRPSALWVWLYGMAVWGLLMVVQQRRLA